MVKYITNIGGNVLFTSYPALKHNVMSETYNNLELYEWLLQHKKKIV